MAVYDGHTCDSTVQVRRLAFHAAAPDLIFFGMGMFVINYDDSVLAAQANVTEYLLNRDNYSLIKFKDKLAPRFSWTFPWVTGHKYKIHWANTGIDFESM